MPSPSIFDFTASATCDFFNYFFYFLFFPLGAAGQEVSVDSTAICFQDRGR